MIDDWYSFHLIVLMQPPEDVFVVSLIPRDVFQPQAIARWRRWRSKASAIIGCVVSIRSHTPVCRALSFHGDCVVDRFTKNFFWKFKKWIVNSMEDYQIKHVRIFFWSQMSLLHKVLDPPSYTRDLQRAKFQKSILGHNFWMECPTDLNSTPLSYIFNALFRDIPLAYLTQHLTRDICDACDVTYVTYMTHVT